ncbi:DUF2934 domain-containing protein [Paracoccus sp. YIM 132242]|uniref:DUF2934 domain-containing protein n=1 Tax=Paracoccus lichenicola TaxID=2665644 RepID=A0A6L6HPK9_9RHOB|nr:DUF2934 domain-containing protein [Paracoccus lichenicola]MTE01104.1 DUF2934 domain-containing protein [Paracoccus lichenicola]
MMDDDRISHRAHQIWEAEGRPEGRDAQHWAQAQDELRREGILGDDSLSELDADTVPDDNGKADGRIIEAGEGGTAGGLDEAEEAILSPLHPDRGDGR